MTTRVRLVALFSVLGVGALVLYGISAVRRQPPGADATAATEVRIFSPFTASEESPRPATTVRGSCFGGSVAMSGRDDAWRCSSEDLILDPCFSDPSGSATYVLCSESPWDPSVRLDLGGSLPTLGEPVPAGDPTVGLPWYLELSTGERCGFIEGATLEVAGLRLSYGCDGGLDVYGAPDRSMPVWQVFVQGGSSELTPADIARAWF